MIELFQTGVYLIKDTESNFRHTKVSKIEILESTQSCYLILDLMTNEKKLVIKDIFNKNNFLLEIIKEPIRLIEGRYYRMLISINNDYNLQVLYTPTGVKLINNKNELEFEIPIHKLHEKFTKIKEISSKEFHNDHMGQ
jgi:hypothetical protein